jgi:hypothetical protein
MLERTLGQDSKDPLKRIRLELRKEPNLDLIRGSLVDLLGNGEGLVSNHQKQGLQQNPKLSKISMDFDQSVLSRLLALRNTVLGKSMRVGADYQNVTVN